MRADFAEIKERVEAVTRTSPLAKLMKGVELEADFDRDDGEPFLRIILKSKSLKKIETQALVDVSDAIRRTVRTIDDRFPSVRFNSDQFRFNSDQ